MSLNLKKPQCLWYFMVMLKNCFHHMWLTKQIYIIIHGWNMSQKKHLTRDLKAHGLTLLALKTGSFIRFHQDSRRFKADMSLLFTTYDHIWILIIDAY